MKISNTENATMSGTDGSFEYISESHLWNGGTPISNKPSGMIAYALLIKFRIIVKGKIMLRYSPKLFTSFKFDIANIIKAKAISEKIIIGSIEMVEIRVNNAILNGFDLRFTNKISEISKIKIEWNWIWMISDTDKIIKKIFIIAKNILAIFLL